MNRRPDHPLAGPGQESVWEYPRPPRLEPTPRLLEVVFANQTIAATRQGFRVLETTHPPLYFISFDDIVHGTLIPVEGTTRCEWKGVASYFDVRFGGRVAHRAAFTYSEPVKRYEAIRGYVSFYARLMDECRVDGEVVEPQPGDFYSGWITQDVIGPFKGGPGTWGW
ncbi:MAG: DUF427 domain-containing protein [Planctomycetota bacterium]